MACLGDNRLSLLPSLFIKITFLWNFNSYIKLHLLVHYMPVGKISQFCHYFTLVLVYELSDFISDLKLFKLKPSTMSNIQLHLEVSSWFLHINGSAQTNTMKTAHNMLYCRHQPIVFSNEAWKILHVFSHEFRISPSSFLARKIFSFGLVMIDFIIGQTWQHFSFLLRCHTPLKSDIPKRRERKEKKPKDFFHRFFIVSPFATKLKDWRLYLFSFPLLWLPFPIKIHWSK